MLAAFVAFGDAGKKMLADHYDVYLKKEQPGQRTLCGHYDMDDGSVPGSLAPYLPMGAFDGKVVDTAMAKKWQFWARWGRPCGMRFKADEFVAEHPQYEAFRPYLPDFPTQPWTVFQGQD